jgi:hypothetical protein
MTTILPLKIDPLKFYSTFLYFKYASWLTDICILVKNIVTAFVKQEYRVAVFNIKGKQPFPIVIATMDQT